MTLLIHNALLLYQITVGLEVESVCKNAGRCINVGNSHKCECQPGYTGSYCEEMVDECKSNPCRNGATCKDYQGTYECIVSNFSAVCVTVFAIDADRLYLLCFDSHHELTFAFVVDSV